LFLESLISNRLHWDQPAKTLCIQVQRAMPLCAKLFFAEFKAEGLGKRKLSELLVPIISRLSRMI
jgi:hypothetical protein